MQPINSNLISSLYSPIRASCCKLQPVLYCALSALDFLKNALNASFKSLRSYSWNVLNYLGFYRGAPISSFQEVIPRDILCREIFTRLYPEDIKNVLLSNKKDSSLLEDSQFLTELLQNPSSHTSKIIAAIKSKLPKNITFPALKSLHFGSRIPSRQDLLYLFSKSPHLQTLTLRAINEHAKKIDTALIVKLAKWCPDLQSIRLSDCAKIKDSAIEVLARSCKNLHSIDLSDCSRLTDQSLLALAKHCPNLKSIYLGNCTQFTSQALVHLAQSCPQLQSIDLSDCDQINDQTIKNLAPIFKNLQVINLTNCQQITDQAAKDLAQSCKNLRSITLDGCHQMTNQTLKTLAENCPTLQRISVFNWAKVEKQAIQTLAELHPNIRFV